MNVSRLSGCSSLMPFASETRVGMMGSDECRAVMETRVVPALSLAKVLKLMPPDLPNYCHLHRFRFHLPL